MVRNSFIQVAEDSNTNLVHLISEVQNGRPCNPTAFVQTGHGCQTLGTGSKHLRGQVRHRYSGTFRGSKDDYIRNVHVNSSVSYDNAEMLRKSGLQNLKIGFGAVMTAAHYASVAISATQVACLWNTFAADGVMTRSELIRIGVESSEIFVNPVGSTLSEVVKSSMNPEENLISVTEEAGYRDSVIEAVGNVWDFFSGF